MLQASEEQWREIADLVCHMAKSGEGTDYCYEAGCLPLPVHFYSPVPDLKDLDQREVWTRRTPLRGIEMGLEAQVRFLTDLAKAYAHECDWPAESPQDPTQFYWNNVSFSFQCASLLHYMIRHHKPRRIIEVGSGMSSRVISAALRMNEAETHQPCEYAIVDPFPSEETRRLPFLASIQTRKVEELDPSFFEDLGAGDILFIDSGHTVKIGGDVNFLFLEVLPVLAPGVVIHVHDIPMPHEYPRVYYTNPTFRVLWTESYLLQAFLMFNNEFEVLGAATYLNSTAKEAFPVIFPKDPKKSESGSFWMRRRISTP